MLCVCRAVPRPQELHGTVYEHVESLWANTSAELAAGSYVARVERSFTACLESLPWWRQPPAAAV